VHTVLILAKENVCGKSDIPIVNEKNGKFLSKSKSAKLWDFKKLEVKFIRELSDATMSIRKVK